MSVVWRDSVLAPMAGSQTTTEQLAEEEEEEEAGWGGEREDTERKRKSGRSHGSLSPFQVCVHVLLSQNIH